MHRMLHFYYLYCVIVWTKDAYGLWHRSNLVLSPLLEIFASLAQHGH